MPWYWALECDQRVETSSPLDRSSTQYIGNKGKSIMKTSSQKMPSNEHQRVVAVFQYNCLKYVRLNIVLQNREDHPNFCSIIEYLSTFLIQSYWLLKNLAISAFQCNQCNQRVYAYWRHTVKLTTQSGEDRSSLEHRPSIHTSIYG